MPGSQTGATHYNVQLGHPEKGCEFKRLGIQRVVCLLCCMAWIYYLWDGLVKYITLTRP